MEGRCINAAKSLPDYILVGIKSKIILDKRQLRRDTYLKYLSLNLKIISNTSFDKKRNTRGEMNFFNRFGFI